MPKRALPNQPSLPGDQRQAQERRAALRSNVGHGVLAAGAWALLVLMVGPSRYGSAALPVGPARVDVPAPFDYEETAPVADWQAKADAAAAAVPVHYAFDAALAGKRIAALHEAFRLVRPRYRLYVADRDRLLAADADPPVAVQTPPHATRVTGTDRAPAPVPASPDAETAKALQALDKNLDDEMTRLRPEFEARVAVRRSELDGNAFAALLKAGFAEEAELLLADVAQVVLSAHIVRDPDRFEDDLGRGVHDLAAKRRYDRRARPEVLSLEEAQRKSDDVLGEFIRQKRPTKLEEPLLQSALKSLGRSMIEPTFARDNAATRQAEDGARDSVQKTRQIRITKGELLAKRGAMVTPELHDLLERMWQGSSPPVNLQSYVATAVLLLLALGLFAAFARRHLHHFRHRPRDAMLLTAILLVHVAVLRALVAAAPAVAGMADSLTPGLLLAALPHALGPSLATLFVRPFTAAPFSLLCAACAALMVRNAALGSADSDVAAETALAALVLGLAGVYAAHRFKQRSDLVAAAAVTSGVGLATAASFGLMGAPNGGSWLDERMAWMAGLGAASGVICYLLLSAITPLFESLFNRLTDIKLVELASMNHPALRLLATEAPGTFTHSVMVGNLAQAACDAIGANGLLARVGAYYHDLGKTKAPRYFAENQSGENPHDKLKPHLSALIIRTHVKDGIRILQDFRLPDEIIDFVPQHHGTSLIAHFYHRATRDALATGDEVNEADFRYPGPKPQRRETALLMVADAVEAACKALPDPNAHRISTLVKKIIAAKQDDGQFDECDLTLRELAQVEAAFTKALVGIHHVRPVYAQPVAAGEVAAAQSSRQEAVPAPDRDKDDLRRAAWLADGGVGARSRNPEGEPAALPTPPNSDDLLN